MQTIIKGTILALFEIIKKIKGVSTLVFAAILLLVSVLALVGIIAAAPVLQNVKDLDSSVKALELVTQNNANTCKTISTEHSEDMENIDKELNKQTMMLGRICGALGIYCE